jgi:hypothetical protein
MLWRKKAHVSMNDTNVRTNTMWHDSGIPDSAVQAVRQAPALGAGHELGIGRQGENTALRSALQGGGLGQLAQAALGIAGPHRIVAVIVALQFARPGVRNYAVRVARAPAHVLIGWQTDGAVPRHALERRLGTQHAQ